MQEDKGEQADADAEKAEGEVINISLIAVIFYIERIKGYRLIRYYEYSYISHVYSLMRDLIKFDDNVTLLQVMQFY